MRNQKLIRALLAFALLGTAFAAFVPTAEAQQSSSITVKLTPPDIVKPLQGATIFNGEATLTADYSGVSGVIGIPVTYTVTKYPAWATVIVSPTSDIFPVPAGTSAPGGASYQQKLTFKVSVTASDQAPAFQSEAIEITATTKPSTQGAVPATGKDSVPITAGFFSILDVQLAESVKIERPQTAVVFPLKVTNFGNANTKVDISIDGDPGNLQVQKPSPVTLQSKQAGGTLISADIPLTIQTPYKNGYMNEVGVVNFKITSSYALNPELSGDSSSVSVLVTTKGFYLPGPSPILLVGLVMLVAVVARRLRK